MAATSRSRGAGRWAATDVDPVSSPRLSATPQKLRSPICQRLTQASLDVNVGKAGVDAMAGQRTEVVVGLVVAIVLFLVRLISGRT